MNNEDFPNKPRPTRTDNRQYYRFEDYEDAPEQQQVTAAYQQNQGYAENYEPYSYANPNDETHLDHLALGFKIYAGINAFFSTFPIIYLIIGIAMLAGGMGGGRDAPPPEAGVFFIIFALVIMSFGYTLSACSYYAGKFLKERRNYTFCMVMSCINCMFMPLGTVVGVLGILVLVRDSVKNLFQEKARESQF